MMQKPKYAYNHNCGTMEVGLAEESTWVQSRELDSDGVYPSSSSTQRNEA